MVGNYPMYEHSIDGCVQVRNCLNKIKPASKYTPAYCKG